jgi:DNA helicase-2/ATP-dependent DNA helicase PcrA
MENIDELINVMMEFEQGEDEVSLEPFLDKVSLVTDVDLYEDKGNRVSLMTLHCAKGLEFPLVFIVGMEDGLLPHHRRGDEMEDLEEERRLFYVGMTRAKERLFLSRAEKRYTFGVGRANLPSRFLDEIPMELIHLEEREEKLEGLFSQEPRWDDHFSQSQTLGDERTEEISSPSGEGIVLSPEGFFPLRMGMRVRHPKFGEGKVKSVEGTDEDQKATITFQSVGSRRLKVRSANLEILE